MNLLCILLLLSIQYVTCQNGYKFCVSESDNATPKCRAILKGNSQVTCVPVIDSADCALKLIDKKVDFGVFSAEDALFIANLINDKVNVIGELRHKDRLTETFSFQTAVVVRNNHNGGFEGLRSTNYCHPGFGFGQFWTDRVLKEFESVVVNRVCNENKSTTESEIASLSNFFKSACRPGQWAYDDPLDKKLKKKYLSLCSLCDSPGRCSYNGNEQGIQGETLQCLTKNDGGDVAYAALEDVQKYFGLLPNTQPRANANEFKFLCRNQTYQPLRNPCTWINQRWPVVIALKEKAATLKSSIVNDFLCKRTDCQGKWQEAFTLLLENNDQIFTPISSKDENLLKFVNDARTIPTETNPCKNKSVRLCTVDAAEFGKCSWLKQVVISQGIEPKLNCVPGYTVWSCFDRIKKDQADIIGIDTNSTFIAKNNFNLSAVMYQDSNNNDALFLVLPIIKANASIKSLADFKNKRISFPEFDGLAWNTFVTVTKAYSVLPKKCPYVNAVSSFVKGACAPGVYDGNHKYFNSTVPENICSLCTKVTNNNNTGTGECVANSSNKYFGDIGALRLLLEDQADVAVVDFRHLYAKENVFHLEFNATSYRVVCKDGSVKPLGGYSQIATDCAWSFGVGAEIISRSSIKKSERRDITELLLKIDDRFGSRLSSWDNPIMMYRSFNDTVGLIFKESTVDLVPIHNEYTHITSLVELKTKSFEECHEWKSSAFSRAHAPKAYLLVLLMFYCFLS